MQPTNINRRYFLTTGAAAAAALTLSAQAPTTVARPPSAVKLKAKFKQGCMRTNFDPKMSMEDCIKTAAGLG